MQQFVETYGMILKAEPIGEYDRRVVILTKDCGKISAFARGARRQTSRLVGSTDMFCFGKFKLYVGRDSYTLSDASISNYFEEFKSDFGGAMFGMYFLEFTDYITHENNDEVEQLKLLYQSTRALVSDLFDNKLVKAIFEIKTIMLMGEYSPDESISYSDTTKYTVDYIQRTIPEKLFSFGVSKQVLNELITMADNLKKKYFNHSFKSEDYLKMIEN